MIINQPQDQLELGGGGEAGGRLQVVLPLNLDCGKKNLFCWCRDTDGGQSLAMAGWKGEEDTVDNQVLTLNIVTIVTSIYGRSLPSRASTQLCMGTRRTQWRNPPPPSLRSRGGARLSGVGEHQVRKTSSWIDSDC